MKKNFLMSSILITVVLTSTACTAKVSTTPTEQPITPDNVYTTYTTVKENSDLIQDTYFIVSGQEVNVRCMPNTDSEITDVFFRYTVMNGHLIQDGSWCEITLSDGSTRYISSDFITPISANEAKIYKEFEVEKKIDLYGMITNESVSCYYTPSFSSDVMTVLYKDDIVKVSAKLKKGWYWCSYGDAEFYIPPNSLCFLPEVDNNKSVEKSTVENTSFTTIFVENTEDATPSKSNKSDETIDTYKNEGTAVEDKEEEVEEVEEVEKTETETETEHDTEPEPEPEPESESETKQEPETLLLGLYTTDYAFSGYNRAYNLEKAASEMNGMVINPYETFNWCRDMGPCGYDEGYLESLEIQGGEYVTGYGGGICQVSCTLCGAVLSSEGDFELVERYKHGLEQFYIPREYDATVSYPDCNFVFKNNNFFPIMIETYYDGCYLTINICKVN